jgi:hypothetical protein
VSRVVARAPNYGISTWSIATVAGPWILDCGKQLFDEIQSENAETLFKTWQDGRIKMSISSLLLHLRHIAPALFGTGSYYSFYANGELCRLLRRFFPEIELEDEFGDFHFHIGHKSSEFQVFPLGIRKVAGGSDRAGVMVYRVVGLSETSVYGRSHSLASALQDREFLSRGANYPDGSSDARGQTRRLVTYNRQLQTPAVCGFLA